MGLLLPAASNGYAGFTAGGTWTVPAGCNRVWLRVVGGGGGGNGTYGGGCAGFCYVGPIGVTPGQQITVTVGAPGAVNGSGGTSSFGTYASAEGGLAGTNSSLGCAVNGYGDNVFVARGSTQAATGRPIPGFSSLINNHGNGGDANAAGQGGLVEIFW
jgi:hypothetical protein